MDVYEPLRERFSKHLKEVSRTWRIMIDRHLRMHGMTLAQWLVLNILEERGDGLVQREIAEHIGVEGPTLVRLLDKLTAAGLIERRELPHDRRCKTVHLSDTARERLETFNEVVTRVRHDFLRDVEDEDLEACLRAFDRILSHAPEGRATV